MWSGLILQKLSDLFNTDLFETVTLMSVRGTVSWNQTWKKSKFPAWGIMFWFALIFPTRLSGRPSPLAVLRIACFTSDFQIASSSFMSFPGDAGDTVFGRLTGLPLPRLALNEFNEFKEGDGESGWEVPTLMGLPWPCLDLLQASNNLF